MTSFPIKKPAVLSNDWKASMTLAYASNCVWFHDVLVCRGISWHFLLAERNLLGQ
jgi:hypothetical protein